MRGVWHHAYAGVVAISFGAFPLKAVPLAVAEARIVGSKADLTVECSSDDGCAMDCVVVKRLVYPANIVLAEYRWRDRVCQTYRVTSLPPSRPGILFVAFVLVFFTIGRPRFALSTLRSDTSLRALF